MEASFISTAALRNQPRLEVNRLQSELGKGITELATSRHADVGLELGREAGRMITLRNETALLETLMRSNSNALSRLTLTQEALEDMRTVSSDLLATLIAIPPGELSADLVELEALAALERTADRLNASDGGSFLFAGLNSAAQPFNRFDTGPQAAVEAAFLGRFGIAVGDPAAAAITPADMADFLANDFADLFDDPAWGTTWSVASSDNVVSRIGPSERAVTGTNANEQAIRTLVEGLAMMGGLGVGALSEETRQVVVNEGRQMLGQGVTDIAALQGQLGFAQNAIALADERMSIARDLLAQTIGEAEGVDPAEAKVRVDLLTTQLEMSYALTGQLARLSILNYA